MTLSCIIVDDEPLALSLLEAYVQRTPFLSLVQKFSSAVKALAWLEENPVSVVFLDIQMPDVNGLEIARRLQHYSNLGTMRFIFTTAYSQYALEGYKVQAIDYLLKPYNYTDFTAAAEKALQFFTLVGSTAAPEPDKDTKPKDYLFVKVGYETVRIDIDEIAYLESAKDYVKVYHTSAMKPIMAYSTLKGLLEKLPPDEFLKVHRSFVIAKDKITAVTKTSVVVGAATIPVTENYREDFLMFTENWRK